MTKILTKEEEKLFVDQSFKFMHSRYSWWRDAAKFTPTKILDVGACRGHWTDMAANLWPSAEITMVEADPRAYPYLEEHYPNNRKVLKGAAAVPGNFKFFARKGDHPQNAGSGSFMVELTDIFQSDMEEFEVETDTLDNLFPGETFELIKLDTQGTELEIIKGGLDTIKRTQFIQIECSFVNYNQGAPMVADIVSDMRNVGFIPVDMLQLHGMTSGLNVQIDFLFWNTAHLVG